MLCPVAQKNIKEIWGEVLTGTHVSPGSDFVVIVVCPIFLFL